MRRTARIQAGVVAFVALAALLIAQPAAWADSGTFSNLTALPISDRPCGGTPPPCDPGKGTPYPSTILVAGLAGTITKVTVTLTNVSSTFPDDVDVLLVGPAGQNLVLVSDAGGGNDLTNVTVTFDDAAAGTIPDTGGWITTSKPVDYDPSGAVDQFPSPAPAPTAATTLATFNGSNPNGTWSLFAVDDGLGDTTSIAGGWSITITTNAVATPTATAVTSSTNPSTTGSNVTFTATVTNGGSSVGANGSVTFKEGSTVLAGPIALNGSGQASFTTNTLTEGSHTITAEYSGTGTLGASSGSVTQVVDNATVVTGTTFCNTGAITVNDNAAAFPYPSRIFVAAQPLSITKVTLTLKGVSHTSPDDLDVLLIGPAGQSLVVVSDAGGTTDITNVNVTFDDAAVGAIADTGPGWPSPSKPVNYGAVADPFTGATTLAAFNTTNPNGTWSLYVVDDSLGDTGTIAGGWCLDITSTGADAAAPVCNVIGIITGPPKQMQVGVQDTGTGLSQITNVSVTNGTVDVPSFSVGTQSQVVLTATKVNPALPTRWSFDAVDVVGNTRHCS